MGRVLKEELGEMTSRVNVGSKESGLRGLPNVLLETTNLSATHEGKSL